MARESTWHDRGMPTAEFLEGIRCVVFDVGETLVDESRAWTALAELAGVTAFTLMGALGALIERGEDHRAVWSLLGVAAPGGPPPIAQADLYPDALACLRSVRSLGIKVGIVGNQPEGVEAELQAVGFEADFIASSTGWGVSKPSPEFFDRIIGAATLKGPSILYVGDRLDNDVLPARAAGMRTAFLRRGPWGFIHGQRPEAALADLRLESLSELAHVLARRSLA